MLPSAGIKASADWSQNVEAQSPCNPACSLSTLRSLMLCSNAVTDCHARLATGGWLTLARLASHQLDYSPFVWAHNPDLSLTTSLIRHSIAYKCEDAVNAFMYGAACAARRIKAPEYRISGPGPFCRTRPLISARGCLRSFSHPSRYSCRLHSDRPDTAW